MSSTVTDASLGPPRSRRLTVGLFGGGAHAAPTALSAKASPAALDSPPKEDRMRSYARDMRRAYSHSMVAGGLDDTSYTTRLIPGTSLVMRDDSVRKSA